MKGRKTTCRARSDPHSRPGPAIHGTETDWKGRGYSSNPALHRPASTAQPKGRTRQRAGVTVRYLAKVPAQIFC